MAQELLHCEPAMVVPWGWVRGGSAPRRPWATPPGYLGPNEAGSGLGWVGLAFEAVAA